MPADLAETRSIHVDKILQTAKYLKVEIPQFSAPDTKAYETAFAAMVKRQVHTKYHWVVRKNAR